MRPLRTIVTFGLFFAGADAALGHAITQRVGGYQDTSGMTRERVGIEGTVEGKAGGIADMTAQSVNIVATRDVYQDNDFGNDDDVYQQKIYASSRRTNDTASLTASQTWDRTVDTRVMGLYGTDGKVRTRSWAAGMSQWFAHETLRVGYDLSRTVVDQPLYEVLDYDSQDIGNPTVVSSNGVTMAVRHLATPTTIVDYTVSHVLPENRPPQNTGTVAVRQFVPAANGAVHVTVTRADNRGYVTTETNYGQVDAWVYEGAYLQNLWQGGRARAGYRYYKEDEITRAFGDRKQLGSDTVTVAMSQDISKKAIDNLGVPLTLDAAASRYANNASVSARTFELGVTAKF